MIKILSEERSNHACLQSEGQVSVQRLPTAVKARESRDQTLRTVAELSFQSPAVGAEPLVQFGSTMLTVSHTTLSKGPPCGLHLNRGSYLKAHYEMIPFAFHV